VKIFCSRCGREKDVEETARHAIVTCAGCGNRFSVGGPAPQKSGMSTAAVVGIIAVVSVPVVVAIIGILAAIAIPNFIRFQSRSKQTECKTQLRALAHGWESYRGAHDGYTARLQLLGFSPERGNRYAYFAGDGKMELRDFQSPESSENDTQVGVDRFRFQNSEPVTARQLPKLLAGDVTIGVHGVCPDCYAVAACAGNIDNDPVLDVWSVSTRARAAPTGEEIPALVPFNDVNDVTE
jgi:type IV pilus assembly protein PilA